MPERYSSLKPRNKFTLDTLDFWSMQVQNAVQKSETYETFTWYKGICKDVPLSSFILQLYLHENQTSSNSSVPKTEASMYSVHYLNHKLSLKIIIVNKFLCISWFAEKILLAEIMHARINFLIFFNSSFTKCLQWNYYDTLVWWPISFSHFRETSSVAFTSVSKLASGNAREV